MAASIARRSITSVSWNVLAQAIVVVVGFGRSILLARWLEVETFGIYSGALAVVGLASIVSSLGLQGAFVHRAPETADEGSAAAVYLAIQSLSTAIWLAAMLAFAFAWTAGPNRLAFVVISITTAVEQLTYVPNTILVRRVVHRRLALLHVINIVALTAVALVLAWMGAELWALLASEIATSVVMVLGLYVVRPVWRPRLAWNGAVVRYYLRFGLPNMVAYVLELSLQKIDDIWVRYVLGTREMGYYSRAYTFASYPRGVLSAPVALVAGGTFAELAGDRLKLSKAFFRTVALLVRVGFLLSGWLILIAPEFVTLLLGEKWLPMVPIFRVLTVFTLLDPLRDVLASVYVAVGLPKRLIGFRLVQLGVLVAGLFVFGRLWGTLGVALAVDLMLVVGITLMLVSARRHVDFSARRLLLVPGLALLLSVAAAGGAAAMLPESAGPLVSGLVKSAVFLVLYGSSLWLAERHEVMEMLSAARRQLRGTAPAVPVR